uniref:BTB domain-containing protein n=1 Tax=Clastoptera arizonana TaxID=38151 RepID=A0A1B6EF13_9HEMI
MGTNQLYSLSWGEFGNSLSSTVQVLRGHGDLVDVTLAAGGRIFPAHKLVLSAASPLLLELLKSTHCHHPVVMLAGITAPDLEALLQFMYQGEVSVDTNQLPSLLQAAHCLDIQALSTSTLTTETTMTQTMVVGSDDALSRDVANTLLPVRKRKRKQRRSSETIAGVKWPTDGNVENRPLGVPGEDMPTNSRDELIKNDSRNDNPCGEEGNVKKLMSDLPAECTVCGVTLRQSRNLRRHMELIHLKVDGDRGRKRRKQDGKSKEEDTVIQTDENNHINMNDATDMSANNPGSSQVTRLPPPPTHILSPPPPPPPIYQTTHHATAPPMSVPGPSTTLCDTLHTFVPTHSLQFTHDNVFRQHQTELLRGAGLYADTRDTLE